MSSLHRKGGTPFCSRPICQVSHPATSRECVPLGAAATKCIEHPEAATSKPLCILCLPTERWRESVHCTPHPCLFCSTAGRVKSQFHLPWQKLFGQLGQNLEIIPRLLPKSGEVAGTTEQLLRQPLPPPRQSCQSYGTTFAKARRFVETWSDIFRF